MILEPKSDPLEDERCVHCMHFSPEGLIRGLFCSRFCELEAANKKDPYIFDESF